MQIERRIKILRIIARLNIGGPSIHVALLTGGLDPKRFKSTLVAGKVSSQEGDMSYILDSLDEKPIIIPELQRDLSFIKDVKAFFRVFKMLDKEKPDIVHTHTAKAGSIGRIAVFVHNLMHRRKVRVVHTFHGHVFRGYFGELKSAFFVLAERLLAKITDIIIVISKSQKAELHTRYHIAPGSKLRTVRLGFELDPFLSNGSLREQSGRSEEGAIGRKTMTVGIVGRLVPVKNHKMFLESARKFVAENPDIPAEFLIIGDGELRDDLMTYCRRQGLSDRVQFCGWERDLPEVYAKLDVLALTSINEGTPVSIIEAMASSVPVISTDAGGVRDLLGRLIPGISQDGFQVFERGMLCGQDDPDGFANGLRYLIQNRRIQNQISNSARLFVEQAYSRERLFHDVEAVYLDLIKSDRDEMQVLEARDLPAAGAEGLKVLQIYKDYYPPVIGGIEKHVNHLCHGLSAKHVQSEVLVSNTRPKTQVVYDNSIKITMAGEHGRLQSAPLAPSFHSHLKVGAQEADILHFHFPNPTAELALIMSNISKPCVVTYHSDIVRQAKLAKLYSPFLLKFLNRTNAIIATSPNYVDSSGVLGRFRDKCRVIPFGIDFKEFDLRPESAGQVVHVRRTYGPRILLFVGRFRYYKGLHILIEAMKNVGGKLLLIGAGPLEADFLKQIATANLQERVFLLGELSDQDVVTHLHACDVFVLPSILRSEAFGIVQLEAMTCRKPVVCTELGTGTSFVTQHRETGLVVQPNDVNALAEALNYLLENPEIREKYGKAGRRRVEKYFSQDGMIDATIATYEGVLNQAISHIAMTSPRTRNYGKTHTK